MKVVDLIKNQIRKDGIIDSILWFGFATFLILGILFGIFIFIVFFFWLFMVAFSLIIENPKKHIFGYFIFIFYTIIIPSLSSGILWLIFQKFKIKENSLTAYFLISINIIALIIFWIKILYLYNIL